MEKRNKKQIIIGIVVFIIAFVLGGITMYIVIPKYSNNEVKSLDNPKEDNNNCNDIDNSKKEDDSEYTPDLYKGDYDLSKYYTCLNGDALKEEKCELEGNLNINIEKNKYGYPNLSVYYNNNQLIATILASEWWDSINESHAIIERKDNYIVVGYDASPIDGGEVFYIFNLDGSIVYDSKESINFDLARFEKQKDTYLLNYENNLILGNGGQCDEKDRNIIYEFGNMFVKYTEKIEVNNTINKSYLNKVRYQEFCNK